MRRAEAMLLHGNWPKESLNSCNLTRFSLIADYFRNS